MPWTVTAESPAGHRCGHLDGVPASIRTGQSVEIIRGQVLALVDTWAWNIGRAWVFWCARSGRKAGGFVAGAADWGGCEGRL